MIRNSLILKDRNSTVLKKYFLTQNNWSNLDNLYRNRPNNKDSLIEFELDLLENEIQILLSKENLNQEEVLNRRWATTTVDKILSNQLYIGNMEYGKRGKGDYLITQKKKISTDMLIH